MLLKIVTLTTLKEREFPEETLRMLGSNPYNSPINRNLFVSNKKLWETLEVVRAKF